MHCIARKLDSIFKRTGKAMAHKMTAKTSTKILLKLGYRVSNNFNTLNPKTTFLLIANIGFILKDNQSETKLL